MADEVTAVCAGSGETLDLTQSHLVVTVKPVRKVYVTNDLPPEGDDDEDRSETYVGTKSGAGEQLVFKDYGALRDWAEGQSDKPVKVTYNRSDDSHLYAEAAAEGGE